MEGVALIEVVDDSGKVLQRHRVDQFPITIGRAYSNDLIIDDPFVSPQHLRIEGLDGELTVEDCQSLNGVHLVSPRRQLGREALPPNAEIRIGSTLLRFRRTSDSVPEAIPHLEEMPMHRIGIPLLRRHWRRAVVLGFGLLLLGFELWFDEFEVPASLRLAVGLIVVGVAASIAGGANAASYAIRRRSQFMAHFVVLVFWASVGLILLHALEYYSFAFSVASTDTLTWVVSALTFAGYVANDSRLTAGPVRSRRSILTTGAMVGIGMLALFMVKTALSDFFSSGMAFPVEIKPPMFRLRSSTDTETYFRAVQDLRPEIDALASEADWHESDE